MGNILALDLGKNNSAVCIFDRSSLKCKYKTVRTRKQVMHDLFVEFADQIEIVLFETGSQMGWVADIYKRRSKNVPHGGRLKIVPL